MQLKNATNLELRLSECTYRCETELSASELETTIVCCLSDATNELQRLRGIIESAQLNCDLEGYPKTAISPWESSLYIGRKSNNEY